MTGAECFEKLRVFDESWKVSFSEAGIIAREVEDHQLWCQVPGCTSFADFLHTACPWSFSTVYASLRAIRDLSDIPDRDLSAIPASNIHTVRKLSTSVRARPEVIEAAKTKKADDFIGYIRHEFPSQAIEHNKPLRFLATQSQAEDIEEAISMAMENGAMTRTEAIWSICLDYRASAMLERLARQD